MSKILIGLNEANPHNYDSDWDYQDAVAKSGKSRSSYRSQEDDTSDADIAYSKKMYQLSQKQKHDADHNRLATGTNEEQLDELSNDKLSQYKTAAALDAGKADIEGDYKRADKRFSGIVKATKKQFANDTKTVKEDINLVYKKAKTLLTQLDENMQQKVINALKKSVDSEQDPFDKVNNRVDNPNILGTNNKAKSAYYPPSKPPVKKLDKPLPESLGDQLKSTSLDVLMQAKLVIEKQRQQAELAIEKQREAEGEAYKQDLIKNNASRLPKQNIKTFQPIPVLKLGENPDVLRDRLKHLDIAKQKFLELNELIDTIKDKYPLVADKLDQLDNSLLQDVKDGPADNYKTLLIKLTQYKSDLGEKYPTAVAYLAKKKGVTENHDERDEYDNTRQGRDYGKGNLFVDPVSNEFKREVHLGANAGERGRPKNLKGISTKLPADAFGRTTGKIPAGKRGKVYNKMSNTDDVDEGWSQKYKSSINCSHPKGFSQKAHCAGKKKHNESIEMEMICEDCGMCETHVDHTKLDEACWKGYHKEGNKKMFGKTYPNCVKNKKKTNEEGVAEGEVIPMQPRNLLNKNLIIQLKALSETALELFWEGSHVPTAAQGQMAQLSQQEQTKIFNQNVAQFKALGYETSIFEDDMDILFLHSIAREAWYDSKKPMSKYRGLPDLEYNSDNNSLKVIDLIGDDDKGIVYDKNVYEQDVVEEKCPHCNGPMFSEMIMNEKKDACYYKVKSRYKVWPSAYASGALVKCRNKGASNWGNGGKKNESSILEGIEQVDESLHDWFNKEKWVRMDTKGKIKGPCAREPGEGKPKCLPQSKAHSLGKKGRASAAQRKRREDPNPDRSGKAINVDTKKSKG
jgi:hypothetical protein